VANGVATSKFEGETLSSLLVETRLVDVLVQLWSALATMGFSMVMPFRSRKVRLAPI